jgi:hypothetical protein
MVDANVQLPRGRSVSHGQAKVRQTYAHIAFHEYIFGLDVSMSDGRLPFGSSDLSVKMKESCHG